MKRKDQSKNQITKVEMSCDYQTYSIPRILGM